MSLGGDFECGVSLMIGQLQMFHGETYVLFANLGRHLIEQEILQERRCMLTLKN